MTSMPTPLAVITGAARGIGLATTRQFLDAGWRVAMVDRDEDELMAVVKQCEGAKAFLADVS